jgi:hypothetical protein
VQTNTDAVSGEGDETFAVNLTTNASTNGAVLSDGAGTGTIADPGSSIPGVPANLRSNAPGGVSNGGSYSILWDASSGAPASYVLEEDNGATNPPSGFTPPDATFTITAPTTSKSFSKGGTENDFTYRVKACNASSQCSAWSNTTTVIVCPSTGCN